MMLKKWEDLPKEMQTEAVRPYYDALSEKRPLLFLKRAFDISASLILILLLAPLFLILSIAIKLDSRGDVFYRQTRITQYKKHFRIYKFRTMIDNADKIGSSVTVANDTRVTRVGRFIRRTRLDEIPQLFNVLSGDMSFVGTRPELTKYVESYTDEMLATLLLPAGVTSEASICYKDESELLDGADNVDEIYVQKILPEKMYYNLKAIKSFSLFGDIKIMLLTVFSVLGGSK
jgi:lipopolysaccharide/colanic/teichoic acid biosynthesis glycosyltransferase